MADSLESKLQDFMDDWASRVQESALKAIDEAVNYKGGQAADLTKTVVTKVSVDKNGVKFSLSMASYSDYIDNQAVLPKKFTKKVQSGNDLGERMCNAFNDIFELGYEKIIIIGTDCHELNPEILNNSFEKLDETDFVLGPANDGGYYLLGMKKLHEKVFQNKEWSTENVASETTDDIQKLGLSYFQTERLNDIDTEKDLGELTRLLSTVHP